MAKRFASLRSARVMAGQGADAAGLLQPGSRLVVELDVENPGAPDRDTELQLLAASDSVSIPQPRQRLERLGERQTVSFPVTVSPEATPGSRVALTLVLTVSMKYAASLRCTAQGF